MGLVVDCATVEDCEVIAVVLGEIEAYYGGRAVPLPVAGVRAALFGARPAATVFLARDGGEVTGLASVSLLWPAAGADSSLYLKELFVRAAWRRRGVGGQLMAAVYDHARECGCSRVEWTADRDNPAALEFYEALGVGQHPGKVFYRRAL